MREKIQISGKIKHAVNLTFEQKTQAIMILEKMVERAKKTPIEDHQYAVTFVWDEKSGKLLAFREYRQFPPTHI